MLYWLKKPDKISASAILLGTYLLQTSDVKIQEEFLTECLENDLCLKQQYMTRETYGETVLEKKAQGPDIACWPKKHKQVYVVFFRRYAAVLLCDRWFMGYWLLFN